MTDMRFSYNEIVTKAIETTITERDLVITLSID